ncbi:uncharacterized protein K452DRAFT_138378 [Aplosporella prunicola CBS 121167]|uniref:Uncharacterized protein n=1 Tax=Aplosporella prunicola CBS 121167 TaxID=1176127 RepID=A0A6A6AYM2_9PEZI|nr:uncharacterized protein K452DRAFT_138378 [Aplosporella prunicola CBS 121167]KAF2136358.1 hypothetical protein K452DRAFT_138378 [Aplosporella prunicola CBS 121167]
MQNVCGRVCGVSGWVDGCCVWRSLVIVSLTQLLTRSLGRSLAGLTATATFCRWWWWWCGGACLPIANGVTVWRLCVLLRSEGWRSEGVMPFRDFTTRPCGWLAGWLDEWANKQHGKTASREYVCV